MRTSENVDDLGLQERLTSAVAVCHQFKCLQISHAVAFLCICTNTYIHTHVNEHTNKYMILGLQKKWMIPPRSLLSQPESERTTELASSSPNLSAEVASKFANI